MKAYIALLVVGIVMIIAIASCTSGGPVQNDTYNSLERYADASNGVTCYRVDGRDGIWCFQSVAPAPSAAPTLSLP